MPEITTALPVEDKPKDHEDWKKKLGDYAYQLLLLKVVTYIGNATVDLDANGKVVKLDVPTTGRAIVTICDVVGGDITNVIPDELKGDQSLRDFHSAQVDRAAAVLPNNLKAIGDVIEKIF